MDSMTHLWQYVVKNMIWIAHHWPVKLLYSFPPTVSPSHRLCPRGTEAGDKPSSSTFGQGNYIPYVKLLWRQRGEHRAAISANIYCDCREWLCLNLLRHVIVTEKQLIGCEIWGFKTVWWHDMIRSFTYSSKMFVKLQIMKYNERKLKHFEQ